MKLNIKNHLCVVVLFCIIGCDQEKYTDFTLTKFHYIKKDYNEYIINRDNGFHRLSGYQIADSSYGIIVLPGYYPRGWTTKGFEWAEPLHELSKFNVPIWLYLYDWNQCPDEITNQNICIHGRLADPPIISVIVHIPESKMSVRRDG